MGRERIKREAEIAAKAATVNFEPLKNVSLVSYDDLDDEDDSDGAPVEIKTIISYENHVSEEPVKEETEKATKKPRKRKKKSANVHEKDDEAEDALKEVRATIKSHVESFENPPVPGEENSEADEKIEIKSDVVKTKGEEMDCP